MTTFGGGNAGSLLASGSGCRDRPSQCTVACVLPVLVGQRGGGISAGGGDAKLSAVRYLYGKASVDQTCVVPISRLRLRWTGHYIVHDCVLFKFANNTTTRLTR